MDAMSVDMDRRVERTAHIEAQPVLSHLWPILGCDSTVHAQDAVDHEPDPSAVKNRHKMRRRLFHPGF